MSSPATAVVRASLVSAAIDPAKRGSDFQQAIGARHAAGAVAAFVGITRGTGQRGQPINLLELEHYPGMTEASLVDIAAQAAGRFELIGIDICHRCGLLRPGDVIVHVLAGAAHRRAALDACDHAVEQLKSAIPLWKKESGPGGAAWVEAKEGKRR